MKPYGTATNLLLLLVLSLALSACGGPLPEQAVFDYLTALVEKDSALLSSLSCAEWEGTALLELDSFQAVDARLENVTCAQVGSEGETTLVVCQGKIIATYNNEDQELDLSMRTYQVVEQDGESLVCGYR
ncbi:MAG: hypothetical protein FJZ96_12445 [Chloroflexi bacterium]|nr:hypothetical protein [Chloroflexota bacterium]